MNLRDLRLRLRALVTPRRVERELDEELDFHIERETQHLIAQGVAEREARTRARARFGSVPLAADECRDARGIAFFEHTIRDVVYAARAFRRAPLSSLTIVGTVALGLGLIAAVFTLFNAFFFRVDAVRNPGEMFLVDRLPQPGADSPAPFTRAEFDALRRETAVFADLFMERRGIGARVDGRATVGTLVSGNFFHVLGVSAARGRVLTPADDDPSSSRAVIVLSHRGWSHWLNKDPHAIGRIVRLNGVPFEIVGVTPEGFRGLSLGAPDYWAPLTQLAQFTPRAAGKDRDAAVAIVGRLKPGTTPQAAVAALSLWARAHDGDARGADAVPQIRLRPRQGTVVSDAWEALLVFTPIFLAFGLILAIACANVANLLLARGVARQREIGIRLSLGASRLRIIRQLLTESLLLALGSAALGLAISRAVLAGALYATAAIMPPEIAENVGVSVPPVDWRVLVFLAAGALLSTMLFGLVPALQATRLELVRTMRGELTRDARPNRARGALIAMQVGASALLLISSAVFLRSAFAAASTDIGIRTADTMLVEISNEAARGAIVSAVASDPSVMAVAASRPHALETPPSALASSAQSPERDPAGTPRLKVGYRFASPEYFGVLDIGIVRGRVFAAAERSTDSAVVVVSEAASRQLWPDSNPLGQPLQLDADGVVRGSFTVIGVVRDVPGSRLRDWPQALVYLPAARDTAGTVLTLRVRGNVDQVRSALLQRLAAIDPTLTEISTLRTMARIEAFLLRLSFWVTVALAGLALALTLSGLFGVLSYVVEQRHKEIGVRMALGATGRDVTGLVLSQVSRQVGIGLVAGGSLAAAVAVALRTVPQAAYIADLVHVLDPIAYTASSACIVMACVGAAWIPAQRAARIDPMTMLKQD